jgi:hypothetical protein
VVSKGLLYRVDSAEEEEFFRRTLDAHIIGSMVVGFPKTSIINIFLEEVLGYGWKITIEERGYESSKVIEIIIATPAIRLAPPRCHAVIYNEAGINASACRYLAHRIKQEMGVTVSEEWLHEIFRNWACAEREMMSATPEYASLLFERPLIGDQHLVIRFIPRNGTKSVGARLPIDRFCFAIERVLVEGASVPLPFTSVTMTQELAKEIQKFFWDRY